jgi:hypothetical protein
MQSEVRQLLQQIEDEYNAGKYGLSGLSQGTAQHQFITKRVENMQRCQEQLIALVGIEKANEMVSEVGL